MNSSSACGITRRIEETQHVTFDNSCVEKKTMDYVHQTYKKKL